MASGILQERQETELFLAIEDHGYDPDEFAWDEPEMRRPQSGPYAGRGGPKGSRSPPSQTLVHEPSGHQFTFELVKDHHPARQDRTFAVEFSPGQTLPKERHKTSSWTEVVGHFEHWIDIVREEHTTVNPWEQVRSAAPEGLLPAGSRDIPKGETFGPEEQEAVSQRLEDLEQEFHSYRDLTDEQLEVLHSEIDSLREDLEEMEKWKWMKLAVGTSFNLADVLDLDPAQVAGSVHNFLDFVSNLPDQLPPGVS